ncbi:MAG: Crp/Fnr family transcriptional regulator [Lentisphaerae bacterium]|nr:Crp/Fnr family transcriptional regulator [Lentisphaerota bacterium]
MDNALVQLLAESSYFRGLSASSRDSLAAACTRQVIEHRDSVFFEGERGRAVFLLASGSVQLVKTTEDGREVVIKTVQPGELFAEVVLFERDAYPVSAVAVKRSSVYCLPRDRFRKLLDSPPFRDDFVTVLMSRLRYLSDRILQLTAHDVEERFFHFLEEQYGRHESYTPPLSKKDLAAAIGTTPETLTRLILRLKKEKKIRWEDKTLHVSPASWKEQFD